MTERVFWIVAFVIIGVLWAYAGLIYALPYLNRPNDASVVWGVLSFVGIEGLVIVATTLLIRAMWRR